MSGTRRIPSLDGLRAISITLVFLCHLIGTTHYPNSPYTRILSPYGNFGVQVFFVLSGFLITSLLQTEHARTGKLDLKDFYRRRAYRILPASLVYTTLTVLGCFAVGVHLSVGYIAAVFGFSAGYVKHGVWPLGHLWSLGAEEQFYLLWPALLVLGYRYRAWIAVGMIAASALFRASGIVDYTYSFPAVADSLAFGCLLSISSPLMVRLPRWVRSPGPTLLLVTATVVSVPFLHERNTLYWGIEPALIALSIFVLVERRDWLLNNRPIRYVGTLSYSLYLCQQPFLHAKTHNILTSFPLNVGCAVLAALGMHYLVERPMLRRRNRSEAPQTASLVTAG